ncbi:hypothetical protein [Lacticaseibacillus saniviri]|uniref:Uncharacterized protein n=1 Tax=Lacticaseibacillus saniviri JCM 17471 = DSM 24301 TaxID=1293598 RepID=A0A0R2N1G8_9LACO|nr:hypothetical protein [Lacticaseibacillus saniviri]KRO17853.1 hypothetical protein IV56_GL001980 [Lacticaseibacillus saniviri JCM 17471 = DSM 24301]MCG4282746.1 hypothetical protein [Lacticaseibacillus saniviri]
MQQAHDFSAMPLGNTRLYRPRLDAAASFREHMLNNSCSGMSIPAYESWKAAQGEPLTQADKLAIMGDKASLKFEYATDPDHRVQRLYYPM